MSLGLGRLDSAKNRGRRQAQESCVETSESITSMARIEGMPDSREAQLEALELEAEILVAHQLDLVAQVERQLRAVHLTMRRIEQLRSASHRRSGSDAPSNGARDRTLSHLADELTSIDSELDTQHDLCLEMQGTVEKMRLRLRAMRRQSVAPAASDDTDSSSQPSG